MTTGARNLDLETCRTMKEARCGVSISWMDWNRLDELRAVKEVLFRPSILSNAKGRIPSCKPDRQRNIHELSELAAVC